MGVWNAECYVALANAIIQSAAADYTNAYKILLLNPNNKEAQWRYDECQRFFRSKWFQRLTTYDGEALMEQLEQQCEDGKKKRMHKPRADKGRSSSERSSSQADHYASNLELCTDSENQQHRRLVLRPVVCVETGVRYKSVNSAARAVGSHASCIVKACQKGTIAANFHWKYEKGEFGDAR